MHRHTRTLLIPVSLLAMATALVACKSPVADEAADTAAGLPATALHCGKDTDCKGDRICESGQCVAPDAGEVSPEPVETADPYACASGETLLFHCPTTNAKLITLCDAGSTLRYTFGPMGTGDPEMLLSVPRGDASTSQGVAAQTIDLPNANTVYSVFWGVDRISDTHEVEAGVHVQANGRHVATVLCQEDRVQSFMEDVDLKSAF